MNVIATPAQSKRSRRLPVAVAIAAEMIVWAGLIAFIVIAVRSCS